MLYMLSAHSVKNRLHDGLFIALMLLTAFDETFKTFTSVPLLSPLLLS